MKILLINPLDREFLPPSMFPLGLGYVASSLRNAGHEIDVLDLNGNRDDGLLELKKRLTKNHFDLIGMTSIITQYGKVKDLGKFVKSFSPSTPLVIGGAGPTSVPLLYLKNCYADIVCIGEGENTIKEIADCIEKENPLDKCAGIAFKNEFNEINITPERDHIVDINTIPMPAWDIFRYSDIYMENFLFKFGKNRGMSILSTRGCPGHCTYCMCNFGHKLRMRSPENICKEIEALISRYNVKHIHFIDDTFITTPKRIIALCDAFKMQFPEITWSANARANLVNPDILKYMAESGCISVAYGIESGSPKILKEMKKGVTVEQANDAIKWTREAGINLTTYFMIGFPGETPETIRETVEFCKNNRVGGEFFFATPFPGTELYQYARKNHIINDEDLYLEYAGEVRDFLVNLTNMSNEQLFTLKENAEAEVQKHLKMYNIVIKPSVRKDPREVAASLPKF